uniref:Uncharacterized protein n=1 Tax=Seriola dumerili TaxID=41447 RepID=A0A3B4TP03_SERDU
MREHDFGWSEPGSLQPSCSTLLGSEVKLQQEVQVRTEYTSRERERERDRYWRGRVELKMKTQANQVERPTGNSHTPTHTHTEHKHSKYTQFRCVCLLRFDHPVDRAGLFSFMTFHWLTPLVIHAHRKGQLLLDDIWAVSQRECSHDNSLRLASLWEEEQRSKGSEASLCSVIWSFCRTRLLLSILCLTVTQLAGFSGPVSLDQ